MAISEAERQAAVELLEQTREAVLAMVDSVTPEQWSWRAGEGEWSMRDCVEHIVLVELSLLAQAEAALADPPGEVLEKAAEKDARISRAIPSRERKVQSPEPFRPGRFDGDVRQEFVVVREKTLAFARTTQAELRAHWRDHFALGKLDAYQWLLFTGLHCQRHSAQMEEIRSRYAA
ncbi:MAG: DinB family protein [Bryobacteraceae bacterium]